MSNIIKIIFITTVILSYGISVCNAKAIQPIQSAEVQLDEALKNCKINEMAVLNTFDECKDFENETHLLILENVIKCSAYFNIATKICKINPNAKLAELDGTKNNSSGVCEKLVKIYPSKNNYFGKAVENFRQHILNIDQCNVLCDKDWLNTSPKPFCMFLLSGSEYLHNYEISSAVSETNSSVLAVPTNNKAAINHTEDSLPLHIKGQNSSHKNIKTPNTDLEDNANNAQLAANSNDDIAVDHQQNDSKPKTSLPSAKHIDPIISSSKNSNDASKNLASTTIKNQKAQTKASADSAPDTKIEMPISSNLNSFKTNTSSLQENLPISNEDNHMEKTIKNSLITNVPEKEQENGGEVIEQNIASKLDISETTKQKVQSETLTIPREMKEDASDKGIDNIPDLEEDYGQDDLKDDEGTLSEGNIIDKSPSSIDKKVEDIQDNFVQSEDSHFFLYFLAAMTICILAYVGFHNKQKVLALVLEGRRSRGGRNNRKRHTAAYRKLDSNLEEAITSCGNSNVTQVIY